jgi:hypothetical protein
MVGRNMSSHCVGFEGTQVEEGQAFLRCHASALRRFRGKWRRLWITREGPLPCKSAGEVVVSPPGFDFDSYRRGAMPPPRVDFEERMSRCRNRGKKDGGWCIRWLPFLHIKPKPSPRPEVEIEGNDSGGGGAGVVHGNRVNEVIIEVEEWSSLLVAKNLNEGGGIVSLPSVKVEGNRGGGGPAPTSWSRNRAERT